MDTIDEFVVKRERVPDVSELEVETEYEPEEMLSDDGVWGNGVDMPLPANEDWEFWSRSETELAKYKLLVRSVGCESNKYLVHVSRQLVSILMSQYQISIYDVRCVDETTHLRQPSLQLVLCNTRLTV